MIHDSLFDACMGIPLQHTVIFTPNHSFFMTVQKLSTIFKSKCTFKRVKQVKQVNKWKVKDVS